MGRCGCARAARYVGVIPHACGFFGAMSPSGARPRSRGCVAARCGAAFHDRSGSSRHARSRESCQSWCLAGSKSAGRFVCGSNIESFLACRCSGFGGRASRPVHRNPRAASPTPPHAPPTKDGGRPPPRLLRELEPRGGGAPGLDDSPDAPHRTAGCPCVSRRPGASSWQASWRGSGRPRSPGAQPPIGGCSRPSLCCSPRSRWPRASCGAPSPTRSTRRCCTDRRSTSFSRSPSSFGRSGREARSCPSSASRRRAVCSPCSSALASWSPWVQVCCWRHGSVDRQPVAHDRRHAGRVVDHRDRREARGPHVGVVLLRRDPERPRATRRPARVGSSSRAPR